MPTKIQIIMSSRVNPILLRPVLGIVLSIDSVLLKMEQFTSWLQSGHRAVSFSPLMAVIVSVKQLRNVHQTERFCDSIVLIIKCLSLLFCGSVEAWETFTFLHSRGRGHRGAFVLGGKGSVQGSAWF